MSEFQTLQSENANTRQQDILLYEALNRISVLEEKLATQTVASVNSIAPSIVNLLYNTDKNHSLNTWFESAAGTGNSSKELAYFFTNILSVTTRLRTNALTNPSDTVTNSIKTSDHTNFSSNIQSPRWDKAKGQIEFGKTNSIDVPLGNFDSAGVNFIGVHPLRPANTMSVQFLIARKSSYVYPKGRIYAGLWNNKSGSEGWLKGSNYALTGKRQGTGVPAATDSTQYMIAIENDQGYTIVSDVVTIADAPTLPNLSAVSYNFIEWLYLAGQRRVRIFRKIGTGNVFELAENPNGNSYQDKGISNATDTGITTFPTFSGSKTAIEAYWASTEAELKAIKVDGVDASWNTFKIRLGLSNSINFGNVENPFFVIGLTESASIRVTDAVANSTTAVSSASGQFTSAMNGKAFTLTNPSGVVHTGTVTYVDANNITLSVAAPFTATGCELIIEDCVDDAFYIDKIGLSFGEGEWSPRGEDTRTAQIQASNPNGSSQGTGQIGSGGGDGETPIYGGGYDDLGGLGRLLF